MLEVEKSSARGWVSSEVGVTEETSGMETFAEEEVVDPEVEDGRSTALILSAEVIVEVEATVSLRNSGAWWTGESMSGAELLTKAGEEVGRVELVLIRRRSQESSSPRRFRQFGSIGNPRILFMPKEIGPWGVTLALLTMAK